MLLPCLGAALSQITEQNAVIWGLRGVSCASEAATGDGGSWRPAYALQSLRGTRSCAPRRAAAIARRFAPLPSPSEAMHASARSPFLRRPQTAWLVSWTS